jgi:hypothetical protein
MLVSLPQYCIHNEEGALAHVGFPASFQVVTLTLDAAVAPSENLTKPVFAPKV